MILMPVPTNLGNQTLHQYILPPGVIMPHHLGHHRSNMRCRALIYMVGRRLCSIARQRDHHRDIRRRERIYRRRVVRPQHIFWVGERLNGWDGNERWGGLGDTGWIENGNEVNEGCD